MIYRRTWFGCVLWFLYTILCIALLVIIGGVWVQYFTGFVGTSLMIAEFAVIPAAVCLYWIIRCIAVRIREKCTWKDRTVQIVTCIVFILIMAGGILVRYICLNEYMTGIRSPDLIGAQSMEYFNMAVVTGDSHVSPMDYGITYLYVVLLSDVLSFLGNKVASAIFLQALLQVIGLVLAYAVTRKMARRLPACVALLYLAGSLCCLNMLTFFSPEWLFFDFYLLGMLVTVSFVKSYCANRIRKPLAVIGSVVIGVMIGGLTYLDATGASLLVVVLIAAVGKKTEAEAADAHNYSKGMNAAVIVCAFLFWAAAWHGITYAAACVKGTRFLADITQQMWLSYRNSSPFTNVRPYFSDIYLIGLLIIPASFLVFEFFRSGKEQNYMPWILLCLTIAPTPLATYGEHGFVVQSLYIWAVLAGIGLQNCLFGGKAKEIQEVIEEINTEAEKASESGQIAGAEAAAETQDVIDTQATEGQRPKPRYIENPLPLPKRHVAREMDYQYDVAEKDMKYDMEVSENDDFDVK